VIVDTLVDNGIDAMRRRRTRRLRVGAAREGDMLVVTVADQGMGIAPDVQQRLFKEHIVKQTGEPGMGMGLLLAQLIAQTYGGEIAIVATGPRGTTMCIRLPAET
jgi:two-component system C4-dicarboxylate transport sensor histidine kinase DctB